MQPYKPKGYWTERGKEYPKEFTEKYGLYARTRFKILQYALILTLKTLDFDSVLDVGCGFGRIIRRVLQKFGDVRITGLDFSKTMLENARHYVRKDVKLVYGDASRMPFKDASFDLVLSNEVLLHVPPSKIGKVRSEMARVARKYIVMVEFYTPVKEKLERHCFNHDHKTAFEKMGFEVKRRNIPTYRQHIYVVRK